MKDNVELQRTIFTYFLIIIATIMIIIIIAKIKSRTKQYEYYVKGYHGTSFNCYVDKDEDLKCQVGNYLISVDEYYIAE